MIYVADGPSDVPVFAVVKQMGGKTYAVYDPKDEREFVQTCELVERSRVHNNGPADYRESSPTAIWMKQKVKEIMRNMIKKRKLTLMKDLVIRRNIFHLMKLTDESESPIQETLWK